MKQNNKERGSGLIEYVLLVVIVSVAAIAAMQFCGESLSNGFDKVALEIDGTGQGAAGGNGTGACEGPGCDANGGDPGFTGE